MTGRLTPSAGDDTRSQPAKDRTTGETKSRQGPGLPGATALRGAQPPPPKVQPRCGYCRCRISSHRSGDWYHDANGSVHCHPGSGDGKKAFPGGAS